MEREFKQVKKAAELSDEQFAALIYGVILASGGSQAQAMAAAGSARMIKNKIITADEKELSALASALDPKITEGILKALREKEGQSG
ncbi:MAG: hypothetical protein J6M12_02195 [Clostridia bacterium]|nr:hypothetical protein [Clostridia bacterium]